MYVITVVSAASMTSTKSIPWLVEEPVGEKKRTLLYIDFHKTKKTLRHQSHKTLNKMKTLDLIWKSFSLPCFVNFRCLSSR